MDAIDFSFMILLVLSLVLVKVLATSQETTFNVLFILLRVIAKWQKSIFSILSILVKVLAKAW